MKKFFAEQSEKKAQQDEQKAKFKKQEQEMI
jgi:hypothetical protein